MKIQEEVDQQLADIENDKNYMIEYKGIKIPSDMLSNFKYLLIIYEGIFTSEPDLSFGYYHTSIKIKQMHIRMFFHKWSRIKIL